MYPAIFFSVDEEAQVALYKRAMYEKDAEMKAVTVPLSRATQEVVNNILTKLDIVQEDYEEDTECSSSSASSNDSLFSPFDWKDQVEDHTATFARAFDHLKRELVKFGIIFGRGGFKLVDVHSQKGMLNFEDAKVGKMSGGSDIVLVPYKTGKEGVANQLCVLYEIKTTKRIMEDGGFRKTTPQAILELVAARCLSVQPNVLVILTDLSTGGVAFWFEYSEEYESFSLVSKEMTSLTVMANMVASFVQSKVVADSKYRPMESKNLPLDMAVLRFKKQKLSPVDCLALDAFNEMMDYTADGSKERARQAADWFTNLGCERIPSLVHYSMYS